MCVLWGLEGCLLHPPTPGTRVQDQACGHQRWCSCHREEQRVSAWCLQKHTSGLNTNTGNFIFCQPGTLFLRHVTNYFMESYSKEHCTSKLNHISIPKYSTSYSIFLLFATVVCFRKAWVVGYELPTAPLSITVLFSSGHLQSLIVVACILRHDQNNYLKKSIRVP